MSSMMILKDGSEVPKSTYNDIREKLEKLKKDGFFGVLIDLFKKCQDENYTFPPNIFQDSALKLKECALLDKNDKINPDIKKIVLHCLEGNESATHFVDEYVHFIDRYIIRV